MIKMIFITLLFIISLSVTAQAQNSGEQAKVEEAITKLFD